MKIIISSFFLFFTFSLLSQEKGVSPINEQQITINQSTYAVVVGISDYQDEGIPDLRFADKDAEAFANFLRSPAGGSLDEDHLKVLINQEATQAQFAGALDWLWEVAGENDKAIIYFSGHGDVEKKSLTQPGFLLCWDAPARVYMAGGAFPLNMLQEVISTISVQNKAKVIMVADACRSGKLSGSTVGGAQITGSNLARQYANEIKILSCQPDEYSIEGEQWGGGRGAFSYHLLDGLYGMADGNGDQSVNLLEIGRYLEDHVSKEVAPQSQIPMTVGGKGEKLTVVYPEVLDQLKEGRKGQMQLFAATESRGMEEDVLAAADTNIVEMYTAFKQSILDKKFLEPQNACTDYYYEILSKEPQLERLHSSMLRNYAAALQDDAQQVMNKWLKADVSEIVLSKFSRAVKYEPYPHYLERAAELLGKDHYMYAVLMARKLYFEGFLLALKHNNPDEELGTAALEKFKGALLLQPNMPHAYQSMSQVFAYNMLQPDSMEHYARLAADQAPSWVAPAICPAFILSTKYKQFDQARYYLEKADQIDSNSVFVLNTKGNFYLNIRRFDEAEKYFKKAAQLDSTFTYAFNNLGRIYVYTRRYDEAEKCYKKAVQLDSTSAKHYNNLGIIYKETRRFDEAEKCYKEAIRLDSSFTKAYNNLGNLYQDTQRFDEAEKYLKKAVRLDSTNTLAYNNLGAVYQKTRRFDEAEKYYKKTIRSDSTFWMAYANLGVQYQSFQRWEASAAMTQKAIAYGPPIGELVAMLGNAYTHLPGRLEEAKETLDKGLNMSPDNPDVFIYLAQWSLKKNQMEEAWNYLEQGLEKGIGKSELKLVDLQEEQDFVGMRKDPKWNELMKKYFPDEIKD